MKKIRISVILALFILPVLCFCPILSLAEEAESAPQTISLLITPATPSLVREDIFRFTADDNALLLPDSLDAYCFTPNEEAKGYRVSCSAVNTEKGTRTEYEANYSAAGQLTAVSMREMRLGSAYEASSFETKLEMAKADVLARLEKVLKGYPLDKLSFEEYGYDFASDAITFFIIMPEESVLCPAGWKLVVTWNIRGEAVEYIGTLEWPPQE